MEVGIESPSYLVAEDAGTVMVCATATGALARNIIVTFTTMDGSATGQSVHHVTVDMCPVVDSICNDVQPTFSHVKCM